MLGPMKRLHTRYSENVSYHRENSEQQLCGKEDLDSFEKGSRRPKECFSRKVISTLIVTSTPYITIYLIGSLCI